MARVTKAKDAAAQRERDEAVRLAELNAEMARVTAVLHRGTAARAAVVAWRESCMGLLTELSASANELATRAGDGGGSFRGTVDESELGNFREALASAWEALANVPKCERVGGARNSPLAVLDAFAG